MSSRSTFSPQQLNSSKRRRAREARKGRQAARVLRTHWLHVDDQTRQRRGEIRDCSTCRVCTGERPCLWRTGFFLEQHRPSALGHRFGFAVVKTAEGSKAVVTVRPVREGAPFAGEVLRVAEVVASANIVFVVDQAGAVQHVIAPARQSPATVPAAPVEAPQDAEAPSPAP